jgi:lipoprotein signal peptidase
LAVTALIVFALDYVTKTLALEYLSSQPKQILGTFLQLKLVFNSVGGSTWPGFRGNIWKSD